MVLAQEATLRLKAQTTGLNNIVALNKTLGKTTGVSGLAAKGLASAGVGGQKAAIGLLAVQSAAAPLAALLATVGIGKFFFDAGEVVQQFEAQSLSLQRGLENLGGAAPAAFGAIQESASQLGEATLFNEEDFRQGSALLTSFSNIAVSEYDRVGRAAADLAQLNRTDVRSSYLQLAKALEDPTKGITALSRAGVTFSKQQVETIKSLQESNRLLEAQGIVLGEVEAKYGGIATAAAGGLAGVFDTLGEKLVDIQKGFAPVGDAAAVVLNGILDGYQFVAEDLFPRVADSVAEIGAAFEESFGKITAEDVASFLSRLIVESAKLTTALVEGVTPAIKLVIRLFGEIERLNPFRLLREGALSLGQALGFATDDAAQFKREASETPGIFSKVGEEVKGLGSPLNAAVGAAEDLNEAIVEGRSGEKESNLLKTEAAKLAKLEASAKKESTAETQKTAAATQDLAENTNFAATQTTFFADEMERGARALSQAQASSVGLVESLTAAGSGSIGPAAQGAGPAAFLFQDQLAAANELRGNPGSASSFFRELGDRNERVENVLKEIAGINQELEVQSQRQQAESIASQILEGRAGEFGRQVGLSDIPTAVFNASNARSLADLVDSVNQRTGESRQVTVNTRFEAANSVMIDTEEYVRKADLPAFARQVGNDVVTALDRTSSRR